MPRSTPDSPGPSINTTGNPTGKPTGRSWRFLSFVTLIVGAVVFSFLSTTPAARADPGNIKVDLLGARSNYPQSIRFFVSASSPDGIKEVRLFLRKTGRVTAGAYRDVSIEPDDAVEGEAILATGLGSAYLPPGTEITYFFEIWDRAGAVLRTPEQRVVYEDSRFGWNTLTSGSITLFHHGAGSEAEAVMALEAANKALVRMGPILGFDATEPIRMVLYQRSRDLVSALPLRSQVRQGTVQTEGMAFADERVVLIHGTAADVRGIAAHEITHLAVAEVTGRANTRLPAWLNEGLAEYGNTEPSLEYDAALRRGILAGRVAPLWALSNFSGGGEDIIRAYGQGQSVVEYLISTYGEAKVGLLMQAVRNTFSIDEAMEMVYGFDQHALDSQWRSSVGLMPLPRPQEPEPLVLPTITPTPSPTPRPSPTLAPTATEATTTTPTATPLIPRPTPTASTSPSPTPQPTATAAAEPGRQSSPGCSSPSHSGPLGGDLALFALVLLPVAMIGRRLFFRD